MRIAPSETLLNDIRQAIRHSKKMLDNNKIERMSLIKKISHAKLIIKAGEHTVSKMQTASVDTTFTQMALTQMKTELQELRQSLLMLETIRTVEMVKFRAMHGQLDKFKAPFDPERKREADNNRKQKGV